MPPEAKRRAINCSMRKNKTKGGLEHIMEIGDKKGERVVGTDPEEGLICSGKRLVNSNLFHNVSQRL